MPAPAARFVPDSMRPALAWSVRFFTIIKAPCISVLAWSSLVWLSAAYAPVNGSEAAAVTPLEEWAIERFHWQGLLEGAQTVAVTNVYGDIRARASESDEVEVLAVLQHARDEATPPIVKVERQNGRVHVTVEMPDASRAEDARRVDVSLFVPRTARFVARTRSGLIEGKKLGSDVEALTDRGEIRVSTTGTVDLETAHGPVVVTLLGSSWSAPPTVKTVTGAIELWLLSDAQAEVIAETGGLLTTDYSVDVTYDDQAARKHARARIGVATAAIRLSSAKGDIRILRSAIRPGAAERGESAGDADGRE